MALRSFSKALVTAAYARSLLDYLRAQELDPVRIFGAAAVHRLEAADAQAQMPMQRWARMIERAASYAGDPDLPLKAGAAVKPRHLGALAEVLMGCENLREALEQLSRYVRLLSEIGQPRLEVRDGRAHVLWTWPFRAQAPKALPQFMQATRISFARWLIGHRELKADAHFQFAKPRDTNAYRAVFGGRIAFDQPHTKLVFPARYLTQPLLFADPASRALAEKEAQSLLSQIADEDQIIQRLKGALLQGVSRGRVGLSEVARAIGESSRTLQRRLQSRDLTYRQVLDEVRCLRAQRYLEQPTPSLAQVAFLVGYTEQSTFQNAFRRWTGISPGAYRSRSLSPRARQSPRDATRNSLSGSS